MALQRYVGVEISALSNMIKREVPDGGLLSGETHMTNMQAMFLYFLNLRLGQGNVYQRDLEMVFNIRRSTATGILKLMERDGFILREAADGDARLKRIILTDKAAAVVDSVGGGIAALELRLRAGLTDAELDTFFIVMDKLKSNMKGTDL